MSRNFRLILLTFVSLLAACTTTDEQEKKAYDGPLFWPQPPDQPRFAYETMLRSQADIVKVSDEASLRETLTGIAAVSTQTVFDKPSAIVARNGRIYVADTGTHTIVVFDVPRRRLFRFGKRHPGNLLKPAGTALDAGRNVYVADSKLRNVMGDDTL